MQVTVEMEPRQEIRFVTGRNAQVLICQACKQVSTGDVVEFRTEGGNPGPVWMACCWGCFKAFYLFTGRSRRCTAHG